METFRGVGCAETHGQVTATHCSFNVIIHEPQKRQPDNKQPLPEIKSAK